MYHPTTRVLTVLELLQTYGQLSSGELAQRLEVNRRSIRRYVTMLQDLGIPVESTRGRNGGYRLKAGYKVPPLMFTNNEAMALTLGLITVDRLGIAMDEPAVEGALAKISRVLPEAVRDQVNSIQNATVPNDVSGPEAVPSDLIIDLSRSIHANQQIWIRYQTPRGETSRLVDPYGLVTRDGYWYLVGWCHLRKALRVFRLDRITKRRILSSRFTPPTGFDPRDAVQHSLDGRFDVPEVELLLKTSIQRAQQWVSIISASLHETADGVVLTCNTGSLEWLASFIAEMPWPVTVRKPAALMNALELLSSRIAAISYAPAEYEKERATDRG